MNTQAILDELKKAADFEGVLMYWKVEQILTAHEETYPQHGFIHWLDKERGAMNKEKKQGDENGLTERQHEYLDYLKGFFIIHGDRLIDEIHTYKHWVEGNRTHEQGKFRVA